MSQCREMEYLAAVSWHRDVSRAGPCSAVCRALVRARSLLAASAITGNRAVQSEPRRVNRRRQPPRCVVAVAHRFLCRLATPTYKGTPNLRAWTILMHGVAPQMCHQVARPLLGGEAGGRSSGFLFDRRPRRPPQWLHRWGYASRSVIT
jgi:hypothetical protein